jgi:hypothetical protein
MARAQDEWVVKKIPGSGVACGVVRYGATAVLRSALVLKGALQYYFNEFSDDHAIIDSVAFCADTNVLFS